MVLKNIGGAMRAQLKRFLSRTEVANQLGISLPTLSHRINDGTIPHVKLGRRILIPSEAITHLEECALGSGAK